MSGFSVHRRTFYQPAPLPPRLGFDVHVLADPHHATPEDLKVLTDTAVRLAGVKTGFSAAELAAAQTATPPSLMEGVQDQRDVLYSALDNDNAKDPEQLEWAEKQPDGSIKVRVAVADVDEVVHRGDILDVHAGDTMGTAFTPLGDYPMLPLDLCNDKTVFTPHADRLALVTEFTVTPDGTIRDKSVYRALVNNHAQLAYNGVANWLDHPEAPMSKALSTEGIPQQIRTQDEVAGWLRQGRLAHGALPVADPAAMNRTQKLVMELMTAANQVNAEFMTSKQYPSICRVQYPTAEDWGKIVRLAQASGTTLPPTPDSAALKAFMDAQQATLGDGFASLARTVGKLLGPATFEVAVPSPDGIQDPAGRPFKGQISSGPSLSAHSTAPDRLFQDLVNQRIMKAALIGAPCPYTVAELKNIALRANVAQKALKAVDRQVHNCMNAVAMQDEIDHTFDGKVTAVTPAGAWMTLGDGDKEGFLAYNTVVSPGDNLQVVVQDVDIEKGRVTLGLAPPVDSILPAEDSVLPAYQ